MTRGRSQTEKNMGVHVAYVLLRFPCLTETFVAEEIRNVQQKGVNILLYSLLPPRDKLVHTAYQQLVSQVEYVPDVFAPSLLLAQMYYLFKSPVKYFALLRTILQQPAPQISYLLKRIVIFFKSIWLARQLENTPVQLVHTHFAWLSAVTGIVISQLLDIPFTVTAHAYDIYSKKNDLLTLTSRFADRIITISEANKRVICEMNPSLDNRKVMVLHCGIDLDYFHPATEGLSNNTLQITSVGSLLGKKGHEYLIRACNVLKMQRQDFQCVIVGDGPLEHSLRELIHELDLENRVTLAGTQTRDWVRDRLHGTDLFILACVNEDNGDRDGIPVAIMEAMAMGVPVISTPTSGIPELVRNEETGLLVSERDEKAIASAIFQLANDRPLRQMIIKNGQDLVNREYDIVKNTTQLCALFESVIEDRQQ